MSDDLKSFTPIYDSRLLTQVDEDIIIITAWGPAICLKGSYIVTYNANENDYNTLEHSNKHTKLKKHSKKQKNKQNCLFFYFPTQNLLNNSSSNSSV